MPGAQTTQHPSETQPHIPKEDESKEESGEEAPILQGRTGVFHYDIGNSGTYPNRIFSSSFLIGPFHVFPWTLIAKQIFNWAINIEVLDIPRKSFLRIINNNII